MKSNEFENFFTASSYLGFIIKKVRQGGIWRAVSNIVKRIRKYTLISGIIKASYIAVILLEKSAILLLIASIVILIFPFIITAALLYAALCIFKYLRHNKEIKLWLSDSDKITVFITKEKIFSGEPKLFLRAASFEASEYSHPVIILCADRFISLKWYGLNLLGIRSDYFFIIKKHFLSKTRGIINYIVIY